MVVGVVMFLMLVVGLFLKFDLFGWSLFVGVLLIGMVVMEYCGEFCVLCVVVWLGELLYVFYFVYLSVIEVMY